MKWLSVKKYKPPVNNCLFLIEKDGGVWVGWVGMDGKFKCNEIGVLEDVTHFCIPDPLEIEDE